MKTTLKQDMRGVLPYLAPNNPTTYALVACASRIVTGNSVELSRRYPNSISLGEKCKENQSVGVFLFEMQART